MRNDPTGSGIITFCELGYELGANCENFGRAKIQNFENFGPRTSVGPK